jgi:hydrogenase expression/formation protein HypC
MTAVSRWDKSWRRHIDKKEGEKMCLAIPGKIMEIIDDVAVDDVDNYLQMRTGKVSFGGIVKEVNLAYVPEAEIGDYVIVHVGFVISTLDEEEAERVFDYLEPMNELEGVVYGEKSL